MAPHQHHKDDQDILLTDNKEEHTESADDNTWL
jgi:hypothetical protein